MIRKLTESNRVLHSANFLASRPQRIAETINFHRERADFWARCAKVARNAVSKTARLANANKHFDHANLLEFELNDNDNNE